MPPVEGYKHSEVQISGEPGRLSSEQSSGDHLRGDKSIGQSARQSVGETPSEVRIKNRITGDRLEGADFNPLRNDRDLSAEQAKALRDENGDAVSVSQIETGQKAQASGLAHESSGSLSEEHNENAVVDRLNVQESATALEASSRLLKSDSQNSRSNKNEFEDVQHLADQTVSITHESTSTQNANTKIMKDDGDDFDDLKLSLPIEELSVKDAFEFLTEQTKDS